MLLDEGTDKTLETMENRWLCLCTLPSNLSPSELHTLFQVDGMKLMS